MELATITRYPVKSMLGEQVDAAVVGDDGLEHDRRYGLLDTATGYVASSKQPRWWRLLLQYSAAADDGRIRVTAPGGRVLDADDPRLPDELSAVLGRAVTVSAARASGSEVERPDPEDVLVRGVDAEVEAPALEIGQGTRGDTFVDHSPVHLITTATLDRIGLDPVRYRPNLVISGGEPFAENGWVGRELTVGEVVLRVVLPTPRCAVPTLEHGDLPRDPQAIRPLMTDNRVDVPGFGVLPCAGAYAEVLRGGTIRRGDAVTLA